MMRTALLGLAVAASFALQEDPARSPASGFAIPTFHCLGLYWSPPGGSADQVVSVRYRKQGAPAWKDALPMRYNPIPNTEEDLADYRGSVVNLSPATAYEIQLSLAGSAATTTFT